MVAKGAYDSINLATHRPRCSFEQLQAGDAEIVQEPTEQPSGYATAPSATRRAT